MTMMKGENTKPMYSDSPAQVELLNQRKQGVPLSNQKGSTKHNVAAYPDRLPRRKCQGTVTHPFSKWTGRLLQGILLVFLFQTHTAVGMNDVKVPTKYGHKVVAATDEMPGTSRKQERLTQEKEREKDATWDRLVQEIAKRDRLAQEKAKQDILAKEKELDFQFESLLAERKRKERELSNQNRPSLATFDSEDNRKSPFSKETATEEKEENDTVSEMTLVTPDGHQITDPDSSQSRTEVRASSDSIYEGPTAFGMRPDLFDPATKPFTRFVPIPNFRKDSEMTPEVSAFEEILNKQKTNTTETDSPSGANQDENGFFRHPVEEQEVEPSQTRDSITSSTVSSRKSSDTEGNVKIVIAPLGSILDGADPDGFKKKRKMERVAVNGNPDTIPVIMGDGSTPSDNRKKDEAAKIKARQEKKLAEEKQAEAERALRIVAEIAERKRIEKAAAEIAEKERVAAIAEAEKALTDATPVFPLVKGTHTKNENGALYVDLVDHELYITYHDATYNVTNPATTIESPKEWGAKITMHLLDVEGTKLKNLKFKNTQQRTNFLGMLDAYRTALTAYKQKMKKLSKPKNRRRLFSQQFPPFNTIALRTNQSEE